MTEQAHRKYEFVEGDTIEFFDKTLKRIRVTRDIGDVKKGNLGGYIEKEENLSHGGDCWVGDDAKVYGDAEVYGSTNIDGNADIYG